MVPLSVRFPKKSDSHNILIAELKKLYADNKINTSELARLTDIGYERLRRLLFDDAVWTVDEWFRVIVVTDSSDAIAVFYENQQKFLIKYQQTARYKKLLPVWHPDSRREEHNNTLMGKRRAAKERLKYKKKRKKAINKKKNSSVSQNKE